MKRPNGFTIMEIMVAVSLVGIAVLGTFNVISYFKLQYNKNYMMIDARLSSTLGERILYIHLKNAFPSFNNFPGTIGQGTDSQNFYELNTEYPNQLRPAPQQSRVMVLSPTGKTRAYFFVADAQEGPPLYIDPVRLYDSTPGTAAASGTLSYIGLTNHDYIKRLAKDNVAKGVRTLWRNGNVIYFYVPGMVRPPGMPDNGFAQPYCFFGSVNGTQLVQENFGGLVDCKDPQDGSVIPDLNSFMMRLPSMNGGIPIVLARSVTLVRYDLVEDANIKGHYNLTYSSWKSGAFPPAQTAATDIVQVTFTRSSVADPLISVEVKTRDVNKKEVK